VSNRSARLGYREASAGLRRRSLPEGARQQVAAYALLVDAKDDVAKAFYETFGFKTFQDAPLTLYLPLGR
jgi:hypothetical protein